MKRTVFLANRAPLSRLSLMVSSIAVALVAFFGFAPAAQADWVSPHDFEYSYTAACGEESGVVEYMFTDITNNSPAAIEVLITIDGETVESQLLNPGESMPDFIRPWPFLGFLEMFAVDPTGVEEPQRHVYGYYSNFYSCVDPMTQVSVDLDTECSALEDGTATWAVSQFTNTSALEARFEILVDGSIVRAVALWDGGILPDFTGDLARNETIEVRVILDGNTATLASATNSCPVTDLIVPTDSNAPLGPVESAAEESPEIILPATGSEFSILILSALVLSLAGLGLMAISRVSRRSALSS